jgi:putative chitinase
MDADRTVEQALGGGGARPIDTLVRRITNDPHWPDAIAAACLHFDINTDERRGMFLATCAHESSAFTRLVESLHYSAARLLAVWPLRFSATESFEFAYDDARIGERVYGGRMGNGPEGVGDGYAFRGRGLIQLTGRSMYHDCGRALGVDLETSPSLLEQPTWAALSAGWLWAEEKLCNALADAGDFEAVTRRINGGLNGLDDRRAWLARLRAA